VGQEKIVDALSKAYFYIGSHYYEENKTSIPDMMSLIELIISSHVTSLYNQLVYAVSLGENQEEMMIHVKKLFDLIMKSMEDSGFSVSKINGINH